MLITTLTVITGLGLLSILILNYELKRTHKQIKEGVAELTKQPMQKPVKVGELSRPLWVKAAPLHLVIKK